MHIEPASSRIRRGALLLALAFPPTLSAQVTPPDSTVVLPGVVVTGQRQAATIGGATGVIVRPDSLGLRPVASVEDALRELPFVLVRTNSRGQAEISVRGSDSRQVAVLLDGVPVSLGWDHRTDTGVLPLMGVSSLEFVRGLPSVLTGPNVLGGVLAMNVGSGGATLPDREEIRVMAGVDDAGYFGAGASGTTLMPMDGGRQLLVRGGGGYRTRDGFNLSAEVTDPNAVDGLRTNTDVQEWNGFGAVRLETPRGGWLSLSATGYTAERGVAPELNVDEPRLWRYPDEWQAVVAATAGSGVRETPLGQGDLEVSLGYNAGRQDIEVFATPAYETVVDSESGEDAVLTLRLVGDHTLGTAADLAAAFTYADVRHEEILPDETNDYRQRLWSVGSEVGFRPGASTRVSIGAALDGANTPETGGRPDQGTLDAWGGRVGLTSMPFGANVQLHASASTRARFPALRELYSGALGRFTPNPDLQPERLRALEAGATWRNGDLELQAVAFHHNLQDAVVRVTLPDRNFQRINRDAIRSTGVEVLLGANVAAATLLADLLLQKVDVEDQTEGVERKAEHMPEVRGGVDLTVPLPLHLQALAGLKYTGDQYCVDPNGSGDLELDSSTRLDLGARRGFSLGSGLWRTLRATVSVDNVADAAVYDQCGMPQPGRTLRFGVELH